MNKENCALKLVDEITLYYDARSKKHQILRGLPQSLQADTSNPVIAGHFLPVDMT